MGKFAARLGDPTAHGGIIVLGLPTVLIGGMPAARMGDMHVCPMLNPGVPPPPHVGGPVILGSPMVLIGGQLAARMGDMLICAGPPDSIIMGCPTVLIGEGSSGSGEGGGASGGAGAGGSSDSQPENLLDALQDMAAGLLQAPLNPVSVVAQLATTAAESAAASAAAAFSDNTESSTKDGFWLEYLFTDSAGNPVSNVQYELTQPDQMHSIGSLSANGFIRRDAQQSGQANVRLVNLSNAKWSEEISKKGEKVKLSISAEGFEEGTAAVITIYRKDINGSEKKLTALDASVKGNKIELEVENNFETDDDVNNTQSRTLLDGYYFECSVAQSKAISGLLYIEDFIELELKNSEGNPMANQEYVLFLPNGKVESGKLDSNGYKKIEKIPAGKYSVRFPGLTKSESSV